ncbi:TraA family conjugative transfer protein [Geoalkalibacter subterraneus]|uniref:Conjugal transfer protein TraA n=1 Tax=Geoalkalibacter subterraneus TaxID=483547 RepID=A0A0B5FUJ3_9BACT|nr:TraA family conjugative transfer protein [Geoalkalibacter subterraneus]AJF08314.1 hypothetical protein GSUB_16610 [Geoalkalibacter subterraneus]
MEDKKRNWAKPFALCLMLLAAISVVPDIAMAGGVGGPLDDVYTELTTWTQGSVGKLITLAFIIVGVVAGIVRQSLMAFAVGIGAGLGVYNAEGIVETIFSATI